MSRVALVTGASGGIGSATVRRLLADGVVVTGIDLAPSRVQEAGYHHLVGDVRELEVLRAAVTGVIRREGRLDVVVCAAAVMQGGRPVWETDVEQARQLWQDDVATVWQAARACIPVMLEGPDPGGCRFVALASVAGERGLFHLGGYVAAKHAVIGVVRAIAADLVGTGVTACAVSPGSTRTQMLAQTAAIYDVDDVEDFASHQLVRRLLDPQEVAAAVVFACSPQGAVLNGSVLSAAGGFG